MGAIWVIRGIRELAVFRGIRGFMLLAQYIRTSGNHTLHEGLIMVSLNKGPGMVSYNKIPKTFSSNKGPETASAELDDVVVAEWAQSRFWPARPGTARGFIKAPWRVLFFLIIFCPWKNAIFSAGRLWRPVYVTTRKKTPG